MRLSEPMKRALVWLYYRNQGAVLEDEAWPTISTMRALRQRGLVRGYRLTEAGRDWVRENEEGGTK